jgi:hypothetical protein
MMLFCVYLLILRRAVLRCLPAVVLTKAGACRFPMDAKYYQPSTIGYTLYQISAKNQDNNISMLDAGAKRKSAFG